MKKEVIEIILAAIQPVQARYNEIMREPSYIDTILHESAEKVRPLATQTMKEVRRVTGVGWDSTTIYSLRIKRDGAERI